MNQSIKISEESTLNFLKTYIENNYGYENSSVIAKAHEGNSYYREYEPAYVEFVITTNKYLGSEIGEAKVVLNMNEQEAAAIIQKQLEDNGLSVEEVKFVISDGSIVYHPKTFKGTEVFVRSLIDTKNNDNVQVYRRMLVTEKLI